MLFNLRKDSKINTPNFINTFYKNLPSNQANYKSDKKKGLKLLIRQKLSQPPNFMTI